MVEGGKKFPTAFLGCYYSIKLTAERGCNYLRMRREFMENEELNMEKKMIKICSCAFYSRSFLWIFFIHNYPSSGKGGLNTSIIFRIFVIVSFFFPWFFNRTSLPWKYVFTIDFAVIVPCRWRREITDKGRKTREEKKGSRSVCTLERTRISHLIWRTPVRCVLFVSRLVADPERKVCRGKSVSTRRRCDPGYSANLNFHSFFTPPSWRVPLFKLLPNPRGSSQTRLSPYFRSTNLPTFYFYLFLPLE